MDDAREAAYRLIVRLLDARGGDEAPPSPGGLGAEIGFGVVRHRRRLDWIIARLAGRDIRRIAPAARTVLRIGLYQLLYLHSIPPYAAVSESVSLAGRIAPRSRGFVNWVLRRFTPDAADLPSPGSFASREEWLAVRHSFPPWIARRWVRRFGPDEAAALMSASNDFPALHVRVNRLRTGTEEAARELRGAGAKVTAGAHSPDALRVEGLPVPLTGLGIFRRGGLYVQDESSQLAALALGPLPGERILDACAGVGGKSSHLAEIMGDTGEVCALDSDRRRLGILEENTRRLGLRTLRPRAGDLAAGAPLGEERFDRILVDAPCSGLGIIRRHPEVKWRKRAGDPARLARLQLTILTRAADHLAPGGIIAYSTCTTEPEENEEVVRRFLARHPGFHAVPPPESAIRGLSALLTPEGFLATFPHRHGCNGGFVALLRNSSFEARPHRGRVVPGTIS